MSDDTPEVWRHGPLRGLRRGTEIMFGQVREDVAIEASLAHGKCLCVASGGDTAFSLLVAGAESVTAVDINPAQLYLVELKVAAFRRLDYRDLFTCLAFDASGYYKRLRSELTPEASGFFDTRKLQLRSGLQNCGKVDRVIRLLTSLLPAIHSRKSLRLLLTQPTLEAQREFYDRKWDTWAWRSGIKLVLNRLSLTFGYGKRFGDAVGTGYARYFLDEAKKVFHESLAEENPYLWQTFRGTFAPNGGVPPWLTETGVETLQRKLDSLTLLQGDASNVLVENQERPFDFACLTNILDGANEEFRGKVARAAKAGIRDKGPVVVRSFFPHSTGLVEASEGGLKRVATPDIVDRSLFCRHVEVLEVCR